MRYKLILLVMALSCTSLSWAQQSPQLPIDLTADAGSFDQAAGRAVYTGNVKVVHGLSTLWSDVLTVTLENNAARYLQADATGDVLVRFVYEGDKQPVKGMARQITHDVTSGVVNLIGNAEMQQGSDIITGDNLEYNLKTEVIKGKRVKMTFTPSN